MPWELRFFSNDMSDYEKIEEWFKSIDDVYSPSEKREDMYIYAPESTDLGIKMRNKDGISKSAKLEIKWRKRHNLNLNILGGKINGNLEEWIKWGWDCAPIESNDATVDFFSDVPRGPAVTIGKDRSLRRYVLDNGFVRSVQWIKAGQDGLSCEITKITARSGSWWTIGFEGFGNKNDESEFRGLLEKTL